MSNEIDDSGASADELVSGPIHTNPYPTRSEIAADCGWPEYVDLDTLNFAPILAHVEAILPDARRLAEWADDGVVGDWEVDEMTGAPKADELTGEPIRKGDFGETGANLLQRIYEKWSYLESTLQDNCLWACTSSWRGEDQRRVDAVRGLLDLVHVLFVGANLLGPFDGRIDGFNGHFDCDTPPFPIEVGPGTRLGLPHAVFVRRLTLVAELMRAIVAGQESRRRKMSVDEANKKALELTNTTAKKHSFLALSQTKQAEQIGCSWATYSKTNFFREAVERGWLRERKNAGRDSAGSPPRGRELLASPHGLGRGERTRGCVRPVGCGRRG